MTGAKHADNARVEADPEFQALTRRRFRFAMTLTVLMLAVYFGFILLVAFVPEFLGRSLSGGVTTLGIPIGLGVIIAAFVLTGLYVRRANTDFDAATQRIVARLK